MSNSFFDDDDVVESTPQESFFDAEDISQSSVPMGGELSDVIAEAEYGVQTPPPAPEVSQGRAASLGAQQGLTMGFSEEMGAGVQSGLDRLQRLLNEYTGLVGKSPTQVSEELATQGFQGDLGPTSAGEMYDEAVAAQRREIAAAEEQHPGTMMTADLAASMLIPVPGATAARGISKGVTTGAKALSKAKKGAAIGAGVGALEAAGRTDEDLTSLEGMKDVALGAGLGAATGGIGGKLSQRSESKELAKRAAAKLEEAEDTALRAAGISPSEMSEQIEKQVTKSMKSPEAPLGGPGVMAIEEGIIDPLLKPKGAYKQAREVKDRLQKEYQTLTNTFKNKKLSDKQAVVKAQQATDKIIQGVEDALAKTDDLSEGAERRIKQDLSTLHQELVQAYTSDNPVDALQKLYVKHNDKFFSNATSSGAQARKQLRTELKNIQREYVKINNPEAFDKFADLDNKYTQILDLEQITKRTAGQEKKAGGISDLSRGITARLITGIPGIEVPVTAASAASKKFLEKDITKFAESLKAKNLLEKSKKLQAAAEKPGTVRKALAEGAEEAAIGTTIAGTAGLDAIMTDETKPEPYKLHQKTARIIERSTPEMIAQQAQSIRAEHGQKGEKLATVLEAIAQKDRSGRRAMMFSVLQNPDYREMLMPKEETEEE